jgi:hypothetical protein
LLTASLHETPQGSRPEADTDAAASAKKGDQVAAEILPAKAP